MSANGLISRQTELSANVVQFCRFLREKGIPNGPREEADALRAMHLLLPYDSDTLRLTLRAILTRNRNHQLKFDDLFQQYWRELERAVDAKTEDRLEKKPQSKPQKTQQTGFQTLKSWLEGNKQEEEESLAAFSATQSLVFKDFSGFEGEEIKQMSRLIHLFARSLATQYQRRYQKARQAYKLDLRRTLRQNLRRGGEMLELAFRKRRVKRLKMVVICDVSKSMDLYSRFLVQFIFAFQNVYQRIETFVFGTRLHRITHELKEKEFSVALDKLSHKVNDWSGGTRIGESLQQFCDQYGARLLDDDTLVLILSDGWDTGDTDMLQTAMAYLQRRSHRLIWLNPLAGNPILNLPSKAWSKPCPTSMFLPPPTTWIA
jgi:uncharacterized protein with von Willebrand factor type A (vWA) domain